MGFLSSTVNRQLSERDGAYDAVHDIRNRVNSSRIQAERKLEKRIGNNIAGRRQEAQEFVKNATARVNNIREDLSERVRNFIPDTKRRINDTINEESQEVQEARDDLNDRINKISDNIQNEENKISNIRKEIETRARSEFKKRIQQDEDENNIVNKIKSDVSNHESKMQREVEGLRREIMGLRNNTFRQTKSIATNAFNTIRNDIINRNKYFASKFSKMVKGAANEFKTEARRVADAEARAVEARAAEAIEKGRAEAKARRIAMEAKAQEAKDKLEAARLENAMERIRTAAAEEDAAVRREETPNTRRNLRRFIR